MNLLAKLSIVINVCVVTLYWNSAKYPLRLWRGFRRHLIYFYVKKLVLK